MPDRVRIYLNEMDKLRDRTDMAVDEMLKKIGIKGLISAPEKKLKKLFLKFLKDNSKMVKQTRNERQKMKERVR